MKKLIVGAMALALAQAAQAAVVIDQDARLTGIATGPNPLVPVLLSFGAGQQGRPANAITQTVTAGVAGLLTQIVFDVRNLTQVGGVMRLSLIDGALGAGGAVIGSADYFLPGNAISPMAAIDVSALSYMVAPGKVFQLVAESADPTSTFRGGLFAGSCTLINNNTGCTPVVSNHYAGGTAYFAVAGQSPVQSAYDVSFATYVDTSVLGAVPEPVTWAMMILGFGTIGSAMRRRRPSVTLA